MPQFRYHKRTFLAPASSRTSSYIVAEVESTQGGAYALGTNMLTIADCGRQIQLEFFLGNARDRQRSLAKLSCLRKLLIRSVSLYAKKQIRYRKTETRIFQTMPKPANLRIGRTVMLSGTALLLRQRE